MSILDVKDRIPTNVLSNKAVRYGVYGEDEKLLRYEYIKREDEPIEEGTYINKFLLDNFQGDLYTQDRYSEPTIETDVIQVQNSNGVYYAQYPQLTRPDNEEAVKIQAGKTCVGAGRVQLDRRVIVKQAKVTFYNDSSVTSVRLYGSNDASTWTMIAGTASSTTKTEKYIDFADNETDYRYYAIYGYTTGSPYYIYVYNFQITQWIETTGDDTTTTQTGELIPYMTASPHYGEPTYKSQTIYINKLNLPLTSYEKGKIVNIKGNRLFAPKDFETVAENLFPASSDFTSSSSTKYTSSEGFVLTSSGGQEYLLKAIDDSASTDWQDTTSGLTKQWIRMEVPSPNGYKITKMKLKASWTGQSSQKIAIEGSFDGNTWVELFVWTGLGITVDEDNIQLNNPDFYKYYRVSVALNSGTGARAVIYDWKVREYLKVLSVSEQYITSFEKPYININNLGNKQINGVIRYGEKYSLVYNGQNWDIAGARVVTGSFDGTTSLKTINLGFAPDLVICYSSFNNVKGVGDGTGSPNYKHIPRILTKAYESSADGAITGSGFTYAVTSVTTVYYIAIKF